LDEKKRIQEGVALNDTPAVLSEEIKSNCLRIYKSSYNLLKKPVPPPEKKVDEKPVEEEKKAHEHKTEL
jgi:hypothetical protein